MEIKETKKQRRARQEKFVWAQGKYPPYDGKETQMQEAFTTWMRLEHKGLWPWWHTANERKGNIQHGAQLKRMGVLGGVSDIYIPKLNLLIELKVGSNVASTEQLNFLEGLMEVRRCFICYSLDAARELVNDYCKKDKILRKEV